MANRVVRYILTGESAGAVHAMQDVERQSKKTEASLAKTGRSMQSVGSSLTNVGKTMMMASLPFLAAGAYSIKTAMDFQKSMNLIQTQAGGTEQQVKQLSKGIMEMKGVDQTPQELADGMFHVVSAMNAALPASERVKDELNIQKQAAIGAAIGHSNLEQTTYALVSAMNAIHAPASQARTVMSELNAAVGAGDLRMEELVAAMGTGYLARANTFGISLQSANAALDTMTQKGVPAEQSATRLAMAFSLLGAPSNKASKLLEVLGLSSTEVQARTHVMGEMLGKAGMHTTQLAADLRKPDGIMVALQDLKAHLEMAGISGSEQAQFISSAFGGGRMSGGILTLYQNIPAIQANYNNQLKITGQYGADYKKVSEEAAFKWGELKRQVDKTAIIVGNDLLPPAMAFAKVIGSVLEDVSKLPKWMVEGMMFGAAGTFALGGLSWMTGTAMKGIGSLLTLPAKLMELTSAETAAAGGAEALGLGLGGAVAPILAVTAGVTGAYGAIKGIQAAVNALHPGSLKPHSPTEYAEQALFGHHNGHPFPRMGEDRSGAAHPKAEGITKTHRQKAIEQAEIHHRLSLEREITYKGTEYRMNPGEALNPALQGLSPALAAHLPEYLQVHTHVNLDSRQIVEAVERYSLKRSARK